MPEQQLDLFSAAGIPAEQPLPQALARRPAVVDLDDHELIAAIPAAARSAMLADRAGRNREEWRLCGQDFVTQERPAQGWAVLCGERP